jgi:hypothetical protein
MQAIKAGPIWDKIGPIMDPAPLIRMWEEIYEKLNEEQRRSLLARDLDLQSQVLDYQIKLLQNQLETVRMVSGMIKKKG